MGVYGKDVWFSPNSAFCRVCLESLCIETRIWKVAVCVYLWSQLPHSPVCLVKLRVWFPQTLLSRDGWAPPAISPEPQWLNGQVSDTHRHAQKCTHTMPFNLLCLDGPPLPYKGHISLVITGKLQRIFHLTVYMIIRSNLELPSLEMLHEVNQSKN